MATDHHTLEPFPLFVDTVGPASPSFFASKLGSLRQASLSPTTSHLRPQALLPPKLVHYLRVKHYQYEVTFGLYVMTPGEKLVLNTIVLCVLAALLYGIVFGLQAFIIRTACRCIYYITGSLSGAEELCT